MTQQNVSRMSKKELAHMAATLQQELRERARYTNDLLESLAQMQRRKASIKDE